MSTKEYMQKLLRQQKDQKLLAEIKKAHPEIIDLTSDDPAPTSIQDNDVQPAAPTGNQDTLDQPPAPTSSGDNVDQPPALPSPTRKKRKAAVNTPASAAEIQKCIDNVAKARSRFDELHRQSLNVRTGKV